VDGSPSDTADANGPHLHLHDPNSWMGVASVSCFICTMHMRPVF